MKSIINTEAASMIGAGAVAASAGRKNRETLEWYLIKQGMTPAHARRKTQIGWLLKVAWGLYHYGWAFPFFLFGWGMMLNALYSGTAPHIFFIGLIMAGGAFYSSVLFIANVWRWQYSTLYREGEKPAWWAPPRKRPTVQEISKMRGAPERNSRAMSFQTVMAYTLFLGPYAFFVIAGIIWFFVMALGGSPS